MSHFFLPGLLVISWVGFVFLFRRQKKRIVDLAKALKEIETEESRVFEFLHGLGEAFSTDIRTEDLHRLIVESVARILDAHGGALYLVDRQGAFLIARSISKSCPPLIEVPQNILQQIESTPQALQSYLRLHSIEPGEGVIGTVWRDKQPRMLCSQDPELRALQGTTLKTESAMFAPLVYGKQNLGVLAVANGPMSSPFTESDFAVFKAISEQSAFALYNAIVYSQADEKKRLDLDLQVAQDIQRILLPLSPPNMQGYEIDGVNMPARQMSGDYFDYIKVDGHRWGAVIGDVSGKGVPASLIMAMCRSVLRSIAAGNPSAADVLHRVNRQLYPDIKEDMFISMAYMILDDQTNTLTLCRAGHDAPLLYSAKDQTVSRLNPPGMALGIDRGDVFDRITGDFPVTLEQNDCLILYTDGVTEALDSKGLEFGMKRMIQSIQASAAGGAGAIKKQITDDIINFIGTQPQNDDITVIVIRKK
jgi:sigma-B regulation protein RsbU (phosphoserine phosphatase)